MANYLLNYFGGSMPQTDEERASVMAAWNGWFGQLGDAVVDGGNPCSVSKAIGPDGTVTDPQMAPSGYSVIRAADIEAAIRAAKGCPVLAAGGSVLVSETFNAM